MKATAIIKRTYLELPLIKTLLKQVGKKFFCGVPNAKSNYCIKVKDASLLYTNRKLHSAPVGTDQLFEEYCEKSKEHCFNFLGSGWINVNLRDTNTECNEIDWHCDFISHFHFDESRDSRLLEKDTFPSGVDVKVPWELARMQHLPMIAFQAVMEPSKGFQNYSEFKSEVRDFISNNAIGFGINWVCTMDVALRIVSWLIAADIFNSIGYSDESFNSQLVQSSMEHGLFIINNLEKNFIDDKSGNHYLSDLLGLICIGHYIKSKKTNKWLKFAAKEYRREILKQYYLDGGSYEFSTAYHRLDSEISALAVAFMIAEGLQIGPEQERRLSRSLDFLYAIVGRDGNIIQVGDNDNGHALSVSVVKNGGVKNELSACGAIGLLEGLFNIGSNNNAEKSILFFLKGDNTLQYVQETRRLEIDEECTPEKVNLRNKINVGFGDSYKLVSVFPDFGLIKYSGEVYDLYFRGALDFFKGKVAHVHADALHFEVVSTTQRYYADQGSFLYTPNVEMRSLFRSEQAHNVPIYEGNPQLIDNGCWRVFPKARCTFLSFKDNEVASVMRLEDIIHKRVLSLTTDGIVVTDSSNHDFSYSPHDFMYSSCGYGQITKHE